MEVEQLWESWCAAIVTFSPPPPAPGWVLTPRKDERPGAWPAPVASSFTVVTAHNPGGVVTSPQLNAQAGARLLAEADAAGWRYWKAVGADAHGHSEEGIAVADMTESDGMALGRRWGQLGIYQWEPTRWSVVACDGSRRYDLGWDLEPLP